jgi:hypothetical protein
MHILKRHCPTTIRYTSKNGKVTTRTIVPTFIPADDTVKAIDVTDIDSGEIHRLVESLTSYDMYVDHKTSQILSYEDWLDASHVTATQPIKWRAFKAHSIELI